MASDTERPPSAGSRLAGVALLLWFALLVAAALYASDSAFAAWVNGLIG